MPLLTPYQKRQLLIGRGLDPETWDIDEDSMMPVEVGPKDNNPTTGDPSLQPSIAPQSFDVSKKDSPLKTFGLSALQSAPSSIMGGLGAGAGIALAPESGGLSLLLPLLMGGGAAAGTSFLQNKLEPDSWKAAVAQSAQQNPMSATLGSLSTIPLGGLNPSVANVGRAAGTLGKVLTAAPMAEGEMANLANVGIGAGINAGMDAGQQLVSGKPFNISQLLESAGTGALFNKPNRIGNMLGFYSPEIPDIHQQLQGSLSQRMPSVVPQGGEIPLGQPEIHAGQRPSFDKNTGNLVWKGKSYSLTDAGLQRLAKDSNGMWDYTSSAEPFVPESQTQTMEGEGGISGTPEESQQLQKQIQERNQKIKDFQAAKQELADSELEKQTATLQQQIEANRLAAEEARTKPLVTTETGKEIMPDYTGVTEQANKEVQQESPADLEARRAEGLTDKYSEESALTGLQRESIPTLQKYTPERKWFDILKRFGIEVKGIHIDDNGIPVKTSTGKPVAGQTLLEQGIPKLIKLNLSGTGPQAGADTPVHELYHAFVASLRNSKRPYDQKLVSDYDNIVSRSADYKQWKSQRDANGLDSSPEEYQATNAGYQFIRTHLNTAGEKPLRKWVNDFGSYLKTRFTKHATEEDYRRLLDYRLTNENKPFSEYTGTKFSTPNISAATGIKNQDDEATQKELFNPKEIKAKSAFAKMREAAGGNEDITREAELQQIKDAEQKQSEKSELANTNDSVRRIDSDIQKMIEGLDEEEISPSASMTAKENLKRAFDWSQLPKTKAYIDDAMRPENALSWRALHRMFLSEVAERRNVVEPAGPSTQYDKLVSDFKAAKTPEEKFKIQGDIEALKNQNAGMPPTKPKREKATTTETPPYTPATKLKGTEDYQSSGATKSRPISSEQLDASLKKFAPIPEEKLAQERADAAKEWEEVDKTKTPLTLAKDLRSRYEHVLANRDLLQKQGFDKYSVEMQLNKRRLDGLKLKYEVLRDRRGLSSEPPISSEMHSEESQLPTLNSRQQEIREAKKGGDLTKLQYSTAPVFRSALDTLRRKQGENGKIAADALQQYYPKKDEYFGRYIAPIIRATKGMSQKDMEMVEKVGIKEFRDKADYTSQLTPQQKELHDAIRQSLLKKQQDQIEAGQPVSDWDANGREFKRLPQIDPYYWPSRINPEVSEVLTKYPNSQAAENLKNDFIAHNGNSEQGEAKLENILEAYKSGASNLTRFNANRKAEGIGLPDSWMRAGLMKNMYNYFNRVSSDRAWHDTVELNPDAAKTLGLTHDAWGRPIESNYSDIAEAPEVKDILDRIHGEPFNEGDRAIKAYNRIATSLMLGPLTNVHIMGSSIANGLQYLRPTEVPQAYASAIRHLTASYQHAIETGYHRKDLTSWRDILDTNATSLERLNSIAANISNVSGRNLTNAFTKSFLQGMGEWLVKTRAVGANEGDKTSVAFMKNLDPQWTQGKTYTPEESNVLASNFASLIHGAHDPRTLPNWMLKDTIVQPFFSLMSWNIAQTNQWMRHVWTPATKGNFVPLIMSTLGAVAGGYVIKEAREKLANKQSPIPSLSNIINSERGIEGNIPNIAYNLMAMSSYVGFAGILSVGAKAIEDLAHKNIPQGAAFPLDEVISNPVHHISQFISAMMNDPAFDYVKGGSKLVGNLTSENIQLGRIAMNWMAEAKGLLPENLEYSRQLTKKESELRKWKMVEGLPYEAQTGMVGNPYMDMEMKQFKRTSDIGEAVQSLPKLLETAFKESKGNPEILQEQLQKIKRNSYQTMPNPDDMPLAFIRYLNYLNREVGPQKASAILGDYIMKNQINQVKSEMVPTL